MRGTVAKRIRSFVKQDTKDLAPVVYTTVVTGQYHKPRMGIKPEETTVLGECQRSYYKLLKRLWKLDKGRV